MPLNSMFAFFKRLFLKWIWEMRVFLIPFILHGLFVLTVLSVYFKSNVLPDLRSIPNEIPTPSKRVVLIVADGLPAEYLYDNFRNYSNAPFIRSIVTNTGSWGLSYTRVPTESRPGHIALIAGLYEDPSAVFKGWKENPVLFDSVFNQSEVTFSWGCHDILHLFQKGSKKGNIFFHSYPSSMQEYSGRRGAASELDNWVLDKFSNFEEEVYSNASIYELIHSPKTVLFFHLLGVDVAGHASKPKTLEYFYTIKNADRVVETLVQKINSLFNDTQTTYIFTSDHGMTDWGSHGAGSSIETVTPIVAWGAGIKRPAFSTEFTISVSTESLNGRVYPNPTNWDLDSFVRYDMNQADIAVLMSIILGVPIPVNSVGTLPIKILDFPLQRKAEAYLLNAKQLMEQLLGLEKEFKSSVASFLISCRNELCYSKQKTKVSYIESYLQTNPSKAISETRAVISSIMQGIQYYENFFQNIILCHVFHGFLCIVIFIMGEMFDNWNPYTLQNFLGPSVNMFWFNSILKCICITVFIGIVIAFIGDALPLYYLCYVFLSLILSVWSLWNNSCMVSLPSLLVQNDVIIPSIIFFAGIELLVLSFLYRWILSLMLFAFSFWPFIDINLLTTSTFLERIFWVSSCVALSIFPSLPVVGNEENILMKLLTGFFWLLALFALWTFPSPRFSSLRNNISKVQLFVTIIGLYNMVHISYSYEKGEGLSQSQQLLSFSTLVTFLVVMKCGASSTYSKFVNLSYSVGMSFLFFSMSYDALFPLFLSINLFCWMYFEEKISNQLLVSQHYYYLRLCGFISQEDFRRSFFFIFYILVSFFGIGNLASFNSYDINWIRSFVSTFSPFMMMILILLRTMLPFFLVTCTFRLVIFVTIGNSKVLFMMVLLICDIIAGQLLFTVNNVGSWLEIGTSLTRFLIIESIVLILLILYYIAKLCTPKFCSPYIKYGTYENLPSLLKFD